MIKRRGVSPVIAALLLIAISVAAAVITYTWVMTMIDGQGNQAQTTIRMEDIQFGYTNSFNELIIVIRNAGGVTAQIQTLYVYDGDTRMVKQDDISYAIGAGGTAQLGFTEGGEFQGSYENDYDVTSVTWNTDLVEAHTYTIRIVTDNGFTIAGTYYTPGGW